MIGPVPVPQQVPEIAWRRGIDIAPVDVTDDADVRWLEACVWPDQTERLARLRAAIEMARQEPPLVDQGDALKRTADVVSQAPAGTTIVVFHSALMPYLTEGARREFEELVRGLRVTWISNEGAGAVPSLAGPMIDAAQERGAFLVAAGTTAIPMALGWNGSNERRENGESGHDSPVSPRFLPVHPTGQYSKRHPQVDGHVLRLSGRHAKHRRDGYRSPYTHDGLDRFHG